MVASGRTVVLLRILKMIRHSCVIEGSAHMIGPRVQYYCMRTKKTRGTNCRKMDGTGRTMV